MSIRVGKSGIHGRGCFAGRVFKRGELVGPMTGHTARNLEHPHVLFVPTVDGGERAVRITSELRFANHSTKPNCELSAFTDGRIELHAKRRIEEGEEITFHYGEDWQ